MSIITTPTPRAYHHALWARGKQWWRGALAIVTFIVAYLIVTTVLTGIALVIDVATGQSTLEDLAVGVIVVTPALFLANNLALAASVPLAMLLQWALFGVRPRWVSSVEGRFRWSLMWRLAIFIVPVWILYVAALFVIEPSAAQGEGITATVVALVIIVIVTTPLQAAGEEYGVRGLVARSAGSWFASSRVALVVATVISSVVFMIAHVASDPWLNAYYLLFGVAMSIMIWRTGGLEAAVLVHATNNLLLLVPTMLLGEADSIFERGEGTGGPFVLLPIAVIAVVTIFVSWWARRTGVVRKAPQPPVRGTVRPTETPDQGAPAPASDVG